MNYFMDVRMMPSFKIVRVCLVNISSEQLKCVCIYEFLHSTQQFKRNNAIDDFFEIKYTSTLVRFSRTISLSSTFTVLS